MIASRLNWMLAVVVAIVFVAAAPLTRADDEPKDLDKIPKAVITTLKAKFPKAKIFKWAKDTEAGKVVYDIEFKDGGRKAEADIYEDGTLRSFEMEFDAKNLPKAVIEAVEKKYPKSRIKEVMETTEIKDKKEVHAGFEIVVETADKKEAELTVAKNGMIIEDSANKKEEKK